MKILNRIISLFMVALMLITSVLFIPVSAAGEAVGNYSFTVEGECAESYLAENVDAGVVRWFRRAVYDGCYGNQLDGVSREIYDSLVKNFAEDKNAGMYTCKFKTPLTFKAEILNGLIVENSDLVEIKNELSMATQTAMDAFVYDYPEVFWFRNMCISYSVSVSGGYTGGYKGVIEEIDIIPSEIYSGASDKIVQYEEAVDAVMASFVITDSRYDTLKNIHDYICDNAWYNIYAGQRAHSSEGFFIGDRGIVCEGYAKTFKVICDRLDIPCVLVSGDAGGSHMWNYVQMDDGKWYLVDVTWDDQDYGIYDTYFLAGYETVGFEGVAIADERTEKNDFSGRGVFSFTYPLLAAVKYGAHIHEWETEYTVDKEPGCTENGSKSIHCKTCDGRKSVTVISALDHRWDDGVIDSVSTCRTHGIKIYTCLNDSTHQYTEQLPLNSVNHDGGTYLKGKAEATCTAEGYTGDICCLSCDGKISQGQIIAVKAHTFTTYSADGNATCLTDGTKTSVCNVCKKATDTVVDDNSKDNAEHKYSVRYGYSATCTQEGERTYVCDVCETAAYMEIIPAAGHKGGKATCKKAAECTACGEEYGSPDGNNHKLYITLNASEATCSKTGLTEGKKCADCGKTILGQKTLARKAHKNEAVTVKATLNGNGKTEIRCTDCGYVSDTEVIYAPKKIKLSASSYTYNGKKKTPSVTVKDTKGKKLTEGTDYTVKYSKGRKSPGKYTVTVTFKGNYSGTKKLTFKIIPKKTVLSKVKAGSKNFTVLWKTVSGVTGYEVQYSTSEKFTKKTTKTATVKKSSAKKYTIKKLKKGKKYYVKVRAYKIVSGKKLYGAWSTVKSVKVR